MLPLGPPCRREVFTTQWSCTFLPQGWFDPFQPYESSKASSLGLSAMRSFSGQIWQEEGCPGRGGGGEGSQTVGLYL